MRLTFQSTFLMLFVLLFFSCNGRGRGAANYLTEAEYAYNSGNYQLAKLKIDSIKLSSDDGSYAETLVVTTDGLNYRFNTLEKSYEIVRFSGSDENKISEYIYTYREKPITLHFIGNRTIKVNITQASKNAISHSFELSNLLKSIEQLKHEKEKSEVLIRYLESRKD